MEGLKWVRLEGLNFLVFYTDHEIRKQDFLLAF